MNILNLTIFKNKNLFNIKFQNLEDYILTQEVTRKKFLRHTECELCFKNEKNN